MSKKIISTVAATAVAALSLISSPAMAQDGRYYQGYPVQAQYSGYNGYGYGNAYDERAYGERGYDNREDGRGYRCKSGTTGLIVGAVAGGLLGRAIVGRYRDRTVGTVIGAGVGALAGRAIERSGGRGC